MSKRGKPTKIFFRHSFGFWPQLLLIILLTGLLAGIASANAVPKHDLIKGTLEDDGTLWAVVTPLPIASWNGTIILDLDGNGVRGDRRPLRTLVKWLLANGYAYGGTTRSPVNYDFPKAVDHLVTVRNNFITHYSKTPTRTIAMGGSRGGFVGRLCMERYPEIFNGALVTAGGGAGQIAVMNSKLDSLFVLKTLVDPQSPLQIVGVPNNREATTAENEALIKLVTLANSTPLGRARLALAAGIQQFGAWTVRNSPEPAPQEYEAQYAQLISEMPPMGMNYVFANPIVVRAPIEELAGGVVSWNHGVNYNQMLAISGRKDFVLAMYEKAGLGPKDLNADLRTLQAAPRVKASPDAVAKAERMMSYTGLINGPVLNIDTIGDPADSQSMKIAYQDLLRQSGKADLFRLVWVHRPGHGGTSDLELVTAFATLINRLDTGRWGDTSAQAMNAMADEIASQTDLLPAEKSEFVENDPPKLLRTWDASNWGTYLGEID